MTENLQRYGKWEEVQRLGKGSYGEVTLWRNLGNMQRVAIKKCPLLESDPPEKKQKMRERWEKELCVMMENKNMRHIVGWVDVDSEFREYLKKSNRLSLPVLIMEYCDGGDLRHLLNDIRNSNGMVEYEVRSILEALSEAISYLHSKNIAHRDLKPENIVIKKENGQNIYKITDFGYAKDMICTDVNSQVGTIGYFAPEVLLDGKYSNKCDYWSIGIIAFEVICGCRPFIPHQKIFKWAEELQKKDRKTIAITENNSGQFKHHTRFFPENQISEVLQRTIEETWLTAALDLSPRRGLPVMENWAPDELRCSFFTSINESVIKKILTVFCLNTYNFLSYEVTKETTREELLSQIVKDTTIMEENLFVILPLEQNPKNMDRPINLVLERSKNPMIYVTEVSSSRQSVETTQPHLPDIINDFMSKSNQLKTFYYSELVRNIVFLRRNENRHYAAYLNGLKNYSMFLNHTICTRQETVNNMMATMNQLVGFQTHFELMLNLSKEQIQENNVAHLYINDLSEWEVIEQDNRNDVEKLRNVCGRVEKRYNSVLRRSNEIISSALLKTTEEDFFNVAIIEKIYVNLMRKLSNEKADKICSIAETSKMLDLINETLLHRSALLSSELQDIHFTLGDIHEEILKILSALKNTFDQFEKINNRMREQSRLIQNKFRQIIERSSIEKYQKNMESIPALDSIMSSLNVDRNSNGGNKINFQLDSNKISSLTGMEISCFGEGNDVKSITEESDHILAALQDLSQDFEMSISTLRIPQEDVDFDTS